MLLLGFKVGNPLLNFFALRASPIRGLQYRSFDQIGGHLFAMNGLCEGHRLEDECIKIGLPISHARSPLRPIYRGNREGAKSSCGQLNRSSHALMAVGLAYHRPGCCGPGSSGSKTRGREEAGQVQAGPTLEEQYQELRRLRKKVHSLKKSY
jgi:hypothetical protein